MLSPAYFGSKFGEAEWRAAFAKDPSGELGLLVPVRVQPCDPPGLLATRVYVDLVDVDEATCRRWLLDCGESELGTSDPTFHSPVRQTIAGSSGRFPGAGPAVSNLPPRNRNFSGRGDLLEQMHADLQAGSAAAVVPTEAVHGLGGIGKTELATEYAHRFGSDYDVAWWIPAEQPTSASTALADLAGELGVPEQEDRVADAGPAVQAAPYSGPVAADLRQRRATRPTRRACCPQAGGGHVLVTSRWQAWGRHATPLRLGVLARSESVAFLQRRIGDDPARLDAVADLLGDLPLALEEAAAYLEEAQVGVQDYLTLLQQRFRELFALHGPTTRGERRSSAGRHGVVGVAGPGPTAGAGRGGLAEPVRIPGP